MNAKRLNFKLLAILGVGGAIFLGSVYLIHGFQVKRNAAGLLRRADVAREEGDLEESARLRMRYLSHVPDDAIQYKETAFDLKKALFDKLLARKEITKRDLDLAIRYVGDSVTFNGKDVDVRREASDFWFQLRKYDFAVDNLENFSEQWNDEDRMRYINSLRLLGGPNEAKAMLEFEKTLGWSQETEDFTNTASHPALLDAYQALVMLLMQQNLDRDSAVKVMNQMVEANKDNPKAYLNRSRLVRYVLGEPGLERAYADIEQAYTMAPDDLDVIAAKSGVMLETDRGEEAKRLIEIGLDQAETIQEKSRLYRLLSEVFITLKDPDGAIAVLERGNRECPRDRDLLWNKARLLLDKKEHTAVKGMFKQLKNAGHDDPMIGYLEARIMMDNGEYLKATRGLQKIRGVLPTNMQYDADTYLAAGYGRLGKYDLQLAVVRGLRERYPDNEQISENYLQILLQLGRTKEAQQFLSTRIQELRKAGKPIPNNYELAMMTLEMNSAQLSTGELTESQQAELDKKYEEVLKDESLTERQRQALLVRRLRQNKDPKAAKKMLQDAINSSPETYLLWAMLIIDYSEDEAEALKYFNIMKTKVDAERYAASLVSLRLNLALKHAPDSAEQVMTEVERQAAGFEGNDQVTLLFQLGKAKLTVNDRENAIRLFEKAVDVPGASPQAQVEMLTILFDDAVVQSDPDRINLITNRIRKAVGEEDESYRIIEARRIVWNIRNGQTSETDRADEVRRARQLIESIRRARKEWLPGVLVESDLHRLDKNPVAAIELLEVGHNLQPGNAKIIRAIAQSYRELKQPAKADEWMRKMPQGLRNSGDSRFELTTMWARRGSWTAEDAQKAVKLLEDVAPADSEELANQLLRSQVFQHVKQLDKAEIAAKRCVEIDTQHPDVWTNLVNIFKLQGKKDEALQAIQQAEVQLPEGTKPIVLGRCYAILGELNKAEQSFIAALTADKTNVAVKRMLAETFVADKKIKPALQLIQDIIATGDTNNPKDVLVVFWARRALAKILASTNNHQNFVKALDLIEQNAINEELSRTDISLLVSFCYARQEKSSWDRALLRLDQISKKRKLTDDEIFMQAQLYEKYGDEYWDDVKKMTTGVLARNSSNKSAVQSYVLWLLKRGEVAEAERWATNNLDSGSVVRFRVDVHSDAKRGNFQRAAKKIQQRIPKPDELQRPDAQSQQLTLAGVAEELGQYDGRFYKMSEQMLRQLATAAPSEILRVATVIGLHGTDEQIEESLNMCFNAHKNEVPDVVSAGVALAVLRKHPEKWDGALARVIQDVSKWLDQVSTSSPDNLLLQWRVAEFHDMIGNLDRVETKYKEILGAPEFTNPTDRGMVMNNLAFAMALNGKTAEPLELVAEAKALLGDSADLIDTRGYIYLVQGETDNAIDAFQDAISNGPKSGQKYFHLALAYYKKNDRQQAKSSWISALENGLERFSLPPALRGEFDKMQAAFGDVAGRNGALTR